MKSNEIAARLQPRCDSRLSRRWAFAPSCSTATINLQVHCRMLPGGCAFEKRDPGVDAPEIVAIDDPKLDSISSRAEAWLAPAIPKAQWRVLWESNATKQGANW